MDLTEIDRAGTFASGMSSCIRHHYCITLGNRASDTDTAISSRCSCLNTYISTSCFTFAIPFAKMKLSLLAISAASAVGYIFLRQDHY